MGAERVMIVGLGGIGSELVKAFLDQSPIHITLVDPDVVEPLNFGKQYFFTEKDDGEYKVNVISRYLASRNVPNACYTAKIESLPTELFASIDMVFVCVDNIEARLYVNEIVCSSYKEHLYLIDCGSNKFMGHVRVIAPGVESCLECSSSMFEAKDNGLLSCTIKKTPSSFIDCLQKAQAMSGEGKGTVNLLSITEPAKKEDASIYRKLLELDDEPIDTTEEGANSVALEEILYTFSDQRFSSEFDGLYATALEIAKRHSISPLGISEAYMWYKDYEFTLTPVNTIVAGLCVTILQSRTRNEGLAYNYYFINTETTSYISPFLIEKSQSCYLCSTSRGSNLILRKTSTIGELINILQDKSDSSAISVFCSTTESLIFAHNIPSLVDENIGIADLLALKDIDAGELELRVSCKGTKVQKVFNLTLE